MSEAEGCEICRRIAQVRAEVAGPRGKSLFAQKLGLSPSTYSYYETSRVPPADVLVRIAGLGEVDLRWLLTGQAADGQPVPTDHPVLQRAARLLADRPGAAAPLAAFLDILSEGLMFPQRDRTPSASPGEPAMAPCPELPYTTWLPVLGRSAAGLAQFWSDKDDSVALTSLTDLISRHAKPGPRRIQPAVAGGEQIDSAAVQVVTLNQPQEGVCEFVASPGLKAGYPDAFSLRIDGDSMAPDIAHGDLVILAPTRPAESGRPAVVQLRGQIGVTCKIYRAEGDSVHLIPINEKYPPTVHAAEDVVWALRVLARVRG